MNTPVPEDLIDSKQMISYLLTISISAYFGVQTVHGWILNSQVPEG